MRHPLSDIAEGLRLGARWPLADWRAWDGGPGSTSQLRALLALIDHDTVLVWGGNKSGKTTLNLACGAAWGLGGDHPAVRAWLVGNGLPLDLVPKGPGTAWLLAPSHDDSARYHRSRLGALVGVEDSDPGWRAKGARAESILRVSVPGYAEPAVFVFKAHSQGVQGMKGDSIRYLGPDEECPQPMYNEAVKRLAEEEQGRCVFSMTPDVHKGISWVKGRFIDRNVPRVTEVNIANRDNPHVPAGLLERRVAGMSDVERAAALDGSFGSVHGLVWPGFHRGVHVIPTRVVPKDWPRFAGFDFGWNNPNSVHIAALDPDGILEVYWEFYRPRLRATELGEIVKAALEEEGVDLVAGFGDPSAGGILACAELRGVGLPVLPSSPNDVETGLKNVAARFADSPPTVRIQSSCVELLREITGYRRGPNGKVVKINDHACDDFRYLCNCVAANTHNYGGMSGALDSSELRDESYWHNV